MLLELQKVITFCLGVEESRSSFDKPMRVMVEDNQGTCKIKIGCDTNVAHEIHFPQEANQKRELCYWGRA